MSDLAMTAELPGAEAPTPASTQRVVAMLVCVALAALWFAAAFALVQGGRNVAISSARGAAPVAQPAAQLQARAEAMSATQIRQISAESAEAINAAVPVVNGPNPAAASFGLTGANIDRARSLDCLTAAIYYEAGVEPLDGQRAVAQVVLNRVRHPAYPNTVCGVVFEGAQRRTGCQFSFACDGSLRRTPMPAIWERARGIAAQALNGYVYAPVGLALNYHANYVVPYWASTLAKSAVVGAHIFYRWSGGWGQPAIFDKAYAAREPNALGLRNAALAAEAATAGQSQTVAEAIDKLPGAEEIKLAPSMRGDKRVAVRFNLTARKASDDVAHEDYVKKFEASDNLKWSLSGATTSADEKPLGKTSAASPAPSGGTAVVARP